MGLFDNMATSTATLEASGMTTKKKPTSFLKAMQDRQSGPLGGLSTGDDGLDRSLYDNVGGMLSGKTFAPTEQRMNEALVKAAENARRQTGSQYAPSIGQGAAARAQQGTEQNIFSKLADTQLQIGEQKQAMKERGVGLGLDIAAQRENTRQFDIEAGMKADSQYGYTDPTTGKQVMGSGLLSQLEYEEGKRQFDIENATKKELTYADLGLREKTLAEQGRQFNTEADFKKYALEKQYTDAEAARAWQAIQNEKQISSTEKIATMQYGVETAKLAETARQFNVSTDVAQRQFSETLRYNYDQLSQGQKQFLDRLGLDRDTFEQSKAQFSQELAQREKLAMAQLGMDEKKLAETARQFNISTDQVNQQFRDKLKYDYDSLSQQDKQFFDSLGLDRDKFNASKDQWSAEFGLKERLGEKDLSLREQEIAQNAKQFDTKIGFDKWAVEQGLANDEKNRIWQAIENDKQLFTQQNIATMQNNTERWKQDQISNLTAMGWSHEDAMAEADRVHDTTMANLDRSLTREIESGRIKQEDKALAEKAREFNSEQEFREYALNREYDEAAIDRIWKSNERIAQNAHDADMTDRQMALTREIEASRFSIQERQLLQDASQFRDKMAYDKWAVEQNITSDQAERIWRSKEAVDQRVWEGTQNQLDRALRDKGLSLDYIMGNLDNMPVDQVVSTLRQVAEDAGLEYVVKDDKGNVIKDPATGKPIVAKGLENTAPQWTAKATEVMKNWTPGTKVTGDNYTALSNYYDTLAKDGKAIADTSIESIGTVKWDTEGKDHYSLNDNAKVWARENTGKLYRATNGRIYEVVGMGAEDKNTRGSTQRILFKDVQSGIIVGYSNGYGTTGANSKGFPGK